MIGRYKMEARVVMSGGIPAGSAQKVCGDEIRLDLSRLTVPPR